MNLPTADLCDRMEHANVLPGPWQWYGLERTLHGVLSTVQAAGCNHEIRQALAEPGEGRVLLIDAGGEPGACIGENLALLARRNGWAGLIVHGNVRDVGPLKHIPLGIVARGAWPVRSDNRAGGRRDVPLLIDTVRIEPGQRVWADEDGIVVMHRL